MAGGAAFGVRTAVTSGRGSAVSRLVRVAPRVPGLRTWLSGAAAISSTISLLVVSALLGFGLRSHPGLFGLPAAGSPDYSRREFIAAPPNGTFTPLSAAFIARVVGTPGGADAATTDAAPEAAVEPPTRERAAGQDVEAVHHPAVPSEPTAAETDVANSAAPAVPEPAAAPAAAREAPAAAPEARAAPTSPAPSGDEANAAASAGDHEPDDEGGTTEPPPVKFASGPDELASEADEPPDSCTRSSSTGEVCSDDVGSGDPIVIGPDDGPTTVVDPPPPPADPDESPSEPAQRECDQMDSQGFLPEFLPVEGAKDAAAPATDPARESLPVEAPCTA